MNHSAINFPCTWNFYAQLDMVNWSKNGSNSSSLPACIPFTWGSEALPIPLESGLSLWFATAQRMQRKEGLPVPTLCHYRTWVLPFAFLDFASPGKQSGISLMEHKMPAEQIQGHPRHLTPRHPASWVQIHERAQLRSAKLNPHEQSHLTNPHMHEQN